MDAYIFAVQATQQAIDDAVAAVGSTARAALPLAGARRLYVAVDDADPAGLFLKIAQIAAIPGLDGVTSHLAFDPPTPPPTKSFPTHGAVSAYVGFTLLQTAPGETLSVYTAAQAVAGVVGVAMVTGAAMRVLVESTAADLATLGTIQAEVEAIPGVVLAPDAAGATALGAGFTTA